MTKIFDNPVELTVKASWFNPNKQEDQCSFLLDQTYYDYICKHLKRAVNIYPQKDWINGAFVAESKVVESTGEKVAIKIIPAPLNKGDKFLVDLHWNGKSLVAVPVKKL